MLVSDSLQLVVADAQVDADILPLLVDAQGDGQQVGLCQVAALRVAQVQLAGDVPITVSVLCVKI